MTEADVRNAGMSKETEDDFREMNWRLFQLVVAHEGRRKRTLSAILSSRHGSKQVSCLLEYGTLSDLERAGVARTEHTAECEEEEDARMAQKVIQFEDEDAMVLALKSIMSETLFGEAGAFENRSFGIYADCAQ